jgi:hypothetical protein
LEEKLMKIGALTIAALSNVDKVALMRTSHLKLTPRIVHRVIAQ